MLFYFRISCVYAFPITFCDHILQVRSKVRFDNLNCRVVEKQNDAGKTDRVVFWGLWHWTHTHKYSQNNTNHAQQVATNILHAMHSKFVIFIYQMLGLRLLSNKAIFAFKCVCYSFMNFPQKLFSFKLYVCQ